MNPNSQLPIIPTLLSARLILRPITLKDAEALFEYGKNNEVTRFVPWNPHQNINDSISYINVLLKEYEKRTSLMWAIQIKDQPGIIGTCGFIRYFPDIKCLEVGYAFNPKFARQGYAKEALQRAIKYGFETTDTIRIEGSCVKENEGSARTMMSVEMELEGILHSNFIKNGKVSDSKLFSITRDKYFNNKTDSLKKAAIT